MAERKMATSPDVASELFSRVFGNAPESPEERKFLKSAQQRKQGPALLGAFQSARQRGQFASSNPQANQQQDPGAALQQALDQTQSAVMQANRDIQKAKQKQFTEELRLKLKQDLIGPLQKLMQERGEQRAGVQEFDPGVEGSELATASQQGALRNTDLANRLQSLSDISGAISLREGGLQDLLGSVQRQRQQELQAAQAGLEGATTQLSALGNIQAIRQQQELFGLEKELKRAQIAKTRAAAQESGGTLSGLISSLQKQGTTQVPSFQEWVSEQLQQSVDPSLLSPERRQELEAQYEDFKQSVQATDPTALIKEFERKALESRLPKFATESTREQLAELISSGDLEGARRVVDATGRPLNATQTSDLSDIQSSLKTLADLEATIDAYESKFGPVRGGISTINRFDPTGQAVLAQIDAARQEVGKALEGGVLRAEDERKYKKILANLRDLSSVAGVKTEINTRNLQNRYNSMLDSMSRSGFNVSGFRDVDFAGEPVEAIQGGQQQQQGFLGGLGQLLSRFTRGGIDPNQFIEDR